MSNFLVVPILYTLLPRHFTCSLIENDSLQLSMSHLSVVFHNDCTASVIDAFRILTRLQTHVGMNKNLLI